MRVGILCYYGRTDAAYAALQVARAATELGHDVSILSRDKSSATIHPQWDRHVIRGKVAIQDWIKEQDYMVCDQPVGLEVTSYARKQKTKTYLTCLWDDLDDQAAGMLGGFDNVVFPSRRAFTLIRDKLGLTNLSWTPWDVGVPVTRNPYDLNKDRVGLVWTLEGSQPTRQEPKFLSVVEHVLEKCPNAFFTVTYSELPADGQKDLKKMVQTADGRLEIMKGLAWDKQQYLYGRHDLTVWPSVVEGLGFVGLSSLCMGTPVIAFDHPLVGEIVRDGTNGLLVPCELDYNFLGVPYVQPDYQAFGRCLVELLKDTDRLEKLRHGTTLGMLDRPSKFRLFWRDLFEK